MNKTFNDIIFSKLNLCWNIDLKIEEDYSNFLHKSFDNIKDNSPFILSSHSDCFIYENENLRNLYRKDLAFQIAYNYCSIYVYDNKKDFCKYFYNLYEIIIKQDLNKLNKLEKQLLQKTQVCDFKYKKNNQVIEHLTKIFNDSYFQKKIKSIFKNEDKTNVFLLGAIDSTVLKHYFNFIGNIIKFSIVSQNIEIQNIQKICDNLEECPNEFITSYILNFLKIDEKSHAILDKKRFLDYIYEEYYNNGFLVHGTSSKHFDNIINNGLNGKTFNFDSGVILKLNDIMEKYGLKKSFEGKVGELKRIQFSLSDDYESAVFYSYQSPEYLSRFCANGHNMIGNEFDNYAYWRRDEKACLSNMYNLCKKHNFSKNDTEIVLNNFKNIWKQNVVKNLGFYLFFVPRNMIGRTDEKLYNDVLKKLNDLSFNEIFDKLTKTRFIHDQRYSDINNKFLLNIELPKLSEYFNKNNVGEKYVLANHEKIYFDLLIDKKYYIKLDKTNDKKLTDNVFLINNFNNSFIKDIDIKIANCAIAFTEKGKRIVNKYRCIYDVNKILKMYEKKLMVDIKKLKRLYKIDVYGCLNFLYEIYFDYVIKYKCMKNTNRYFSDLSSSEFYNAMGELDPTYFIMKSYKSNVIDKEKIFIRITTLEQLIKTF